MARICILQWSWMCCMQVNGGGGGGGGLCSNVCAFELSKSIGSAFLCCLSSWNSTFKRLQASRLLERMHFNHGKSLRHRNTWYNFTIQSIYSHFPHAFRQCGWMRCCSSICNENVCIHIRQGIIILFSIFIEWNRASVAFHPLTYLHST